MNTASQKTAKRIRRHARVRSLVSGTPTRPRLAVFKSNKYVYAQLIDDVSGVTLAHATSLKGKGTGVERATLVGKTIAEAGKKAGVTTVVFDRGGFIYTGQVAALAESARAAGLKF